MAAEPYDGFSAIGDAHHCPQCKTSYISLTDRYTPVRSAGHSSEGVVNVVRSHASGRLYVLKTIKHKDRRTAPREAFMLRAVGFHKNIVRLLEAEYNTSGHATMSMEYCSEGDMATLMHKYHDKGLQVPSDIVMQAMVQVGEGLAFIHGGWVRNSRASLLGPDAYRLARREHRNLVIRDLKPWNIFVKPGAGDHPFDFVIGDFGQAFDPALEVYSWGGTPGFRNISPEEPCFTTKTDVYAYGITMAVLCHDYPLVEIGTEPTKLRFKEYATVIGGSVQLLEGCLQPHPQDRLDMSPQGALRNIAIIRHALEFNVRCDLLLSKVLRLATGLGIEV